MAGILILVFEALKAGDRFLIGPIVSYSSLYSVLFLIGIIGFIVMVPCLFFVYKDFSRLHGSEWFKIIFIGLGVGGIYTNLLFMHYGDLYEANQNDLTLVMYFIQPVLLFIMAGLPGTKLRFSTCVAFLFGLIGGYLICFGLTNAAVTTDTIMLVIAAGAFLHATGTIFAKQILQKIQPLTLTYLRIFVSFIVMLVVVGFFEERTMDQLMELLATPMGIGGLDTYVIWVVIFLGIVSYAGGVFAYYTALKKLPLIYVPVLEFSYMVFVLLFFAATYGYKINTIEVIGMVLIMMGVVLQISKYTSQNNKKLGKSSS